MEEERVIINGEDEEKERLLDEGGVSVLDFDLLCSAVAAMQNQGKCKWVNNQQQDYDDDDGLDNGPRGGVLRMWEGDVFDCFDDHRIVLESCCCPWYRFGKNMKRAGFGFCFAQAIVYIVLAAAALVNITAFVVTRRHCFLYMGVAFTFCVGAYMGFHRMQIRKKFNIRGTDSVMDDCLYHLVCPCCTLSQESRTLEINNVQDGTWHGRGDTICVGAYNEGSNSILELRPPSVMSIQSSEPSIMAIT
ncbi:Protein PLANT CADMIUM RESISTANCE like [Heracleum sosnowskyi]|uniref:Protein PLANT CADMIUM RESISTANCE like n=1 Tax=Heracleum sosnowskyi TaxID=360622 RepID=A0AAD8HJV0_9APIA|nr:Protein PLANT CADMIUM RESISTANCE like [Heracleum sosnowskyi]